MPSFTLKFRAPLLALTVGLSVASAGIVSTSSNVQTFSTLPGLISTCGSSSLVPGQCRDADVLAITEKQGYTLVKSVHYNYLGTPDLYDDGSLLSYNLVLPAGTLVNSYFIHFDPPGTRTNAQYAQPTGAGLTGPSGLPQTGIARIVFTSYERIVGLQTVPATMTQSTGAYSSQQLQLPGLTYASSWNGTELGSTTNLDWIDIIDPHTIEFRLDVNGATTDDFRILTVSPEPATAWLAGIAVLGLAARRKFRRA
jgi:hypothetical protein